MVNVSGCRSALSMYSALETHRLVAMFVCKTILFRRSDQALIFFFEGMISYSQAAHRAVCSILRAKSQIYAKIRLVIFQYGELASAPLTTTF